MVQIRLDEKVSSNFKCNLNDLNFHAGENSDITHSVPKAKQSKANQSKKQSKKNKPKQTKTNN